MSPGSSAASGAVDRTALLAHVVDIARRAGHEIMDVYSSGVALATEKDDRSPLTVADLRSHRLIEDALHALAPGIPVLSEESAALPYEERRTWPRYWLVDPLDGTKEFLSRYFKNHDLKPDEDIFALGFVNSLLAMQLVAFVEKEFGIRVEDEDLDLDNFRTIQAISNLVARKQA